MIAMAQKTVVTEAATSPTSPLEGLDCLDRPARSSPGSSPSVVPSPLELLKKLSGEVDIKFTERGSNHDTIFICSIDLKRDTLPTTVQGQGQGKRKRHAEQRAAESVLRQLGLWDKPSRTTDDDEALHAALDLLPGMKDSNPIDALQRLCRCHLTFTILVQAEGSGAEYEIEACAAAFPHVKATGRNSSKKRAKKVAALNLLTKLQQHEQLALELLDPNSTYRTTCHTPFKRHHQTDDEASASPRAKKLRLRDEHMVLIMEAASVEELIAALAGPPAVFSSLTTSGPSSPSSPLSLSFMHVAAAVSRLAKLVPTDADRDTVREGALAVVIPRLDRLVAEHLPSFRARELANLVWAWAKLRHRPDHGLLPHAMERFMDKERLLSANAQEVANVIWGASRLEVCCGPVMEALLERAVALRKRFNAQELANVMWALGFTNQGHDVCLQLMGCVLDKVRCFKPQELASVVWALARIGHYHQECLARLLEASGGFAGFKPQELAMIAWGAAKLLGEGCGAWLVALARFLTRNGAQALRQWELSHLCVLLWAYAVAECCEAPVMALLAAARQELAHRNPACLEHEQYMQLYHVQLWLSDLRQPLLLPEGRPGASQCPDGALAARCRSTWQASKQSVRVSRVQQEVHDALRQEGLPVRMEALTEDGNYGMDILVTDARVAVEVDGPHHFCSNERERALGECGYRRRALERRGYAVVVVHVLTWQRQCAQGSTAQAARELVARIRAAQTKAWGQSQSQGHAQALSQGQSQGQGHGQGHGQQMIPGPRTGHHVQDQGHWPVPAPRTGHQAMAQLQGQQVASGRKQGNQGHGQGLQGSPAAKAAHHSQAQPLTACCMAGPGPQVLQPSQYYGPNTNSTERHVQGGGAMWRLPGPRQVTQCQPGGHLQGKSGLPASPAPRQAVQRGGQRQVGPQLGPSRANCDVKS